MGSIIEEIIGATVTNYFQQPSLLKSYEESKRKYAHLLGIDPPKPMTNRERKEYQRQERERRRIEKERVAKSANLAKRAIKKLTSEEYDAIREDIVEAIKQGNVSENIQFVMDNYPERLRIKTDLR